MTKVTGTGYPAPALRLCCLVALWGLAFTVQTALADITPTGTVDAVDTVGGGSTPVPPSAGNQTFGPEIDITLDTGQLLVDNGSILTAGGTALIDTDTVIVTGSGSQIIFNTLTRNRLDIQGPNGSFQILNGGLLDSAGAGCTTTCQNFLGSVPGAGANILVDGAGSRLNMTDTIIASANTDFGIPGANSIATINVLNGGVINSGFALISSGVVGGNIQVGQITDATVNISGLGSQWNSTSFHVASGFNSIATVNVTNGGLIDTNLFFSVPDATGIATISVDGPGSQIRVTSDMFIGQQGSASLSVDNEALVNVTGSLFAGVNPGSSAVVTVNGIGSQLNAGLGLVAQAGSTATMSITGGATAIIDGDTVLGDLEIGRGAGSIGTVTVSGVGSRFDIIGSVGSVAIGNDFGGVAGGGGEGTLLITNNGAMNIFGTIAGDSDILVGSGGFGVLQIDTGGSLIVDGSLFLGDGGTGVASVSGGASFQLIDISGAGVESGMEIGVSRIFDNGDSSGTLNIFDAGTTVLVQGTSAYVDVATANTSDSGTGIADGLLSVANGASLRVDGLTDLGFIGVGAGMNAAGDLIIDGAGTSVDVTGASGVVLIASDFDDAVGLATGVLNVANGATLNIFGTDPGTSVLGIGVGLGNGVASVTGGSTVNVDGDLFVSVANPFTGNATTLGGLDIEDTSVVTALRTTVGSNGFVGGTGTLVTDSLSIESGGMVALNSLATVQDIFVDGIGSQLISFAPFEYGLSLSVTNGGSAFASAAGTIGSGVAENTASISGVGSEFLVDASLAVGVLGGTGTLSVTDQATTFVFSDTQSVSLNIGDGGTGTVEVMDASLDIQEFGSIPSSGDDGVFIGISDGNLAGSGALSLDAALLQVQGSFSSIIVGMSNTVNTGTAAADGVFNVTNGSTVLLDGMDLEGFLGAGIGANSTGSIVVSGAGSRIDVSGSEGFLVVGSDNFANSVDGGMGNMLITNGASVNVFGTNPDASQVVVGGGAGDGTLQVDNGGSLFVDGTFQIAVGDNSPTGTVLINDTASVIANFTSIGNRGTLGGTGFLVSDTFIDPGGSLELAGSITGNVFNFGGTVDPGGAGVVGGTLSISGNFSQEAGVLRFAVAGVQPGEFDQLDVAGNIDLFGGAVEVELLGSATTALATGLPVLRAGGTLAINEAVAFNVGAGQPSFELVPSEIFVLDPGSGMQVPIQIASLNFLEQNLMDLPNLTGNEASLAASFDDTCSSIAGVSDLTPDEEDLLATCNDVRNAGNTPEQIMQALAALDTEEATQTTNALLLFTIPQHGNLSQRINGIRSGTDPFDLTGLNLRFDDHQIAGEDLERFVKGLLGLAAGDADEFSKWGVFGNGNINFGDKNSTDNGNGFDYETITLTMGVDYRARDNLVFGGTLSYSDVNADFEEGGGMDLTSWAGSAFGTYFLKDKFYFDLLGTYGQNEIDVSRHIVFDTVLGGTVRKASASTDGSQYSFSFGTGYDFTPGAWVFGPHGGANYTELETDSYTEEGAGGLNLTIDRQTATSFTANLGFHVSYTYTPEWGVLIPYLRADWVNEFRDDAETIEVSFAADRFVNDPLNPSQPIRVKTDERDSEYFVYSAGVSVQLIRGVAGFLNYRTAQNLEDLSLTDITWGIRFETQW